MHDRLAQCQACLGAVQVQQEPRSARSRQVSIIVWDAGMVQPRFFRILALMTAAAVTSIRYEARLAAEDVNLHRSSRINEEQSCGGLQHFEADCQSQNTAARVQGALQHSRVS